MELSPLNNEAINYDNNEVPSSICKTSHTMTTWKEEAFPWSIKRNCTNSSAIITGFIIP
ncbi:unnamed protein product [Lupinus luteus]|uniref:Uncharacterized protein n=1 Tax=Lupinus luteus TaxID=3873 RepID=A0AAV1X4L6_LUPLU